MAQRTADGGPSPIQHTTTNHTNTQLSIVPPDTIGPTEPHGPKDVTAANDGYHHYDPKTPTASVRDAAVPLTTEDSPTLDRSTLHKSETGLSEDETRRLAPSDNAIPTPTLGDEAAGMLRPTAGRDGAGRQEDEGYYSRGTSSESRYTTPFPNGYHFPPRYPLRESTQHGLAAFWRFFLTPWGFFWTVYGLNVVAWGGMIFLLLCNAAPAMCRPTCDDIDSPRRVWIEITAQVLTGLFCVTGWGLAPWRFRDLWHLLRYRLRGDYSALQRLAGIHRDWFRLPGSQALAVELGKGNLPEGAASDPAIRRFLPIPDDKMPDPPATGMRARATALWRMDFVVWCMIFNTLGQTALCGIMWGMNRQTRPSWATGFLVAVACLVAIVGGLEMFFEGRKIKTVEGVALDQRDRERLERDLTLGIPHYNNIKDKRPTKEKMGDLEVQAGGIGAETAAGASGGDEGEDGSLPSVTQTARYTWFPRRKKL